MRRRTLLSAGLIGLSRKSFAAVPATFADQSHLLGHRLRDRAAFPVSRRVERVPILIVGGGISGLSAAWRLQKRGFRDFVLLEMEKEAGGNSRSGENEVSRYPWAAHYLPVPSKSATLVRELMSELGVLVDGKWDERYLCHSPQERLFLHGRWQDGLEPDAASPREREQVKRFHVLMDEFEDSGEFAIPSATGRRARTDLDRISMADWLKREGFDSEAVHWHADYACRDDYGARASQTSAWAGIHYFAARGQRDDKGPLTWPEGNGWIVRKLLDRVGKHLRTGTFVHRISRAGTRWRVFAGEAEYQAEAVIFAAPTHLAAYLIEGAPPAGIVYSPWLTANLTLDRWPDQGATHYAWDNVIHRSPALGYVVATHQSLRTQIPKTVWTYYWALCDQAPAEARRLLLEKDAQYWSEAILRDLEPAHEEIRQCVSRIEIMRFGHAMARPIPGHLSRRIRDLEGLYFAHSDLSGFSIFEEAQYRGVEAAERAIRRLR